MRIGALLKHCVTQFVIEGMCRELQARPVAQYSAGFVFDFVFIDVVKCGGGSCHSDDFNTQQNTVCDPNIKPERCGSPCGSSYGRVCDLRGFLKRDA